MTNPTHRHLCSNCGAELYNGSGRADCNYFCPKPKCQEAKKQYKIVVFERHKVRTMKLKIYDGDKPKFETPIYNQHLLMDMRTVEKFVRAVNLILNGGAKYVKMRKGKINPKTELGEVIKYDGN